MNKLKLLLVFLLILFPTSQRVGATIYDNSIIMAVGSSVCVANGQPMEYERSVQIESGSIMVDSAIVHQVLGIGGNNGYVGIDSFSAHGAFTYTSQNNEFVIISKDSQPNITDEEAVIALFGVYVAQNGSDASKGTPSSPVNSFEKARDLARSRKAQYGESFQNTLYFGAGRYSRSETAQLTSADNGLAIKALGDGEVLFSGSVTLPKNHFSRVTDQNILQKLPDEAKKEVYSIDLSPYLSTIDDHPEYAVQSGGTSYYELYDGGESQTLARWPNNDWAFTGTVSSDVKTFRAANTRLSRWSNSPTAMLFGYWRHDWACQPIYISSVDVQNQTVTLSKKPEYGLVSGMRYFALNLLEEIDSPGEWYISKADSMLYYYPINGYIKEDLELTVAKAGMFRIYAGAKNISISDITIQHTRGSAITAEEGTEGILIQGVTVRNIGNAAISLPNTMSSTVKDCLLYNLGGQGINLTAGTKVTLTSGNSRIENNRIYNFGRVFRTYQAGIYLGGR